ncbi:MAG TPA: glycosyltransferase [Caldimonas sp.]|nr:glycosyltransferase [Caldimonas sp.]
MSSLTHGGTTPSTTRPRAAPAPLVPASGAEGVRLSVVIPTFRRPALVTRCLEAVIAQRFDPGAYEVIVVDDGRTTDTEASVEAVARSHPTHAICYLRPHGGHGPAAARNAGWQAARAPVVAFTDDDTVPDPDWLREGERALAADVVAVSGRVVVPSPSPPVDGVAAPPTDHELMTRGLERAEFVTANAFVRRTALFEVGGFDERFKRAWREDSDLQFALLARGRIARCEEAVVVHPVRAEAWGVSLRQQKNVFFDALLYKKHPRLYRERILARPPWDYYAIVALSIAAAVFFATDVIGSALVSAAIALILIGALAWRRLRRTSHSQAHVVEMIVTSFAIPFLSVYWRLRGAIHFRVAYL